jgi:hypothetical protein
VVYNLKKERPPFSQEFDAAVGINAIDDIVQYKHLRALIVLNIFQDSLKRRGVAMDISYKGNFCRNIPVDHRRKLL